MQQESAETIALKALGWLAGNDELLPVFLASSGACEADLRTGAADPTFLAAVLDFLLLDDAWVVNFCDTAGLAYTAPQAARAVLPGGTLPDWT